MTKIVQSKMKAMRRWDTQIYSNIDFSEKKYPPGQHGKTGYRFTAGYCSDLRAKQVVKKAYLLSEKALKTLCRSIKANRKLDFADGLTAALELMAFKVVFNCGFASSVFSAKQLTSHCHFLLNGKKFNLARIRLAVGDVLSVHPESVNHQDIKFSIEKAKQINQSELPPYLKVDYEAMKIEVMRLPSADEIKLAFEPLFTVLAAFY